MNKHIRLILAILIIVGIISAGCSSAGESEIRTQDYVSGEAASGEMTESSKGYDASPMELPYTDESIYSSSNTSVDRMVIRRANISISVEDPAAEVEAIRQLSEQLGGYVVSSNIYKQHTQSGIEAPHAIVSFRVPTEFYNDALQQVRNRADEVLTLSESSDDITQQYTDLASRLRNLEAAEEQMSLIMDEARRTEDVMRVYSELVRIREQIEVIKGQMQYYEQSAALSLITVDITAVKALQPLTIGRWQPKGTAKEAVQVLVNVLRWLVDTIIWLGILVIPVLLVLGLPVYLVWRYLKKRQKSETEPNTVE